MARFITPGKSPNHYARFYRNKNKPTIAALPTAPFTVGTTEIFTNTGIDVGIQDDILVAMVQGNTSAAVVGATGWVLDSSTIWATNQTHSIYTIKRGASAPALLFTNANAVIITAVRGADLTTWIDVAGSSVATSGTNPTITPVKTVTNNALVFFHLEAIFANTVTRPSYFKTDLNDAGGGGFCVFSNPQASAGSTGALSCLMATSDNTGQSVTVIRPASSSTSLSSAATSQSAAQATDGVTIVAKSESQAASQTIGNTVIVGKGETSAASQAATKTTQVVKAEAQSYAQVAGAVSASSIVTATGQGASASQATSSVIAVTKIEAQAASQATSLVTVTALAASQSASQAASNSTITAQLAAQSASQAVSKATQVAAVVAQSYAQVAGAFSAGTSVTASGEASSASQSATSVSINTIAASQSAAQATSNGVISNKAEAQAASQAVSNRTLVAKAEAQTASQAQANATVNATLQAQSLSQAAGTGLATSAGAVNGVAVSYAQAAAGFVTTTSNTAVGKPSGQYLVKVKGQLKLFKDRKKALDALNSSRTSDLIATVDANVLTSTNKSFKNSETSFIYDISAIMLALNSAQQQAQAQEQLRRQQYGQLIRLYEQLQDEEEIELLLLM